MALSRRLFQIAGSTMLATCPPLAAAAAVERLLERRDRARLTTDDTFCSVRGKQVRYRLLGAGEPGPSIVLVSGASGTIEPWHKIQGTLASSAPVLAYDRGGMGFSEASDAHDPEAQVEELEGLLHATQFTPPFVIVGYSASALMVRLFVARHRDQVKGVVLLDPVLPELYYIPPRVFASILLKALVGFTRVEGLLRKTRPKTRADEKERATSVSFHHWYAAAAGGVGLGNWTPRLMAAPPFGPIPVGVVCTFDPARDARLEYAVTRGRILAAESPHGTFRMADCAHTELLTDPVGSSVVLDVVRAVETQARLPKPEC
jgi:pimeloyl-ACP methyl ester carboxylesterase